MSRYHVVEQLRSSAIHDSRSRGQDPGDQEAQGYVNLDNLQLWYASRGPQPEDPRALAMHPFETQLAGHVYMFGTLLTETPKTFNNSFLEHGPIETLIFPRLVDTD
ncbi:hypothetical protein FQN54_008906 [Arachnomyces sp. PD_36]|nr:hypothetical protein FQN54_008906 [Arachnomyces sp. PD_36]